MLTGFGESHDTGCFSREELRAALKGPLVFIRSLAINLQR